MAVEANAKSAQIPGSGNAHNPGETLAGWIHHLAGGDSELASLLRRPVKSQQEAGYFHTLREICQQPVTWRLTAAEVAARALDVANAIKGCHAAALTGSGSSEFAGASLSLALRGDLGIPVDAVPAGLILTHGSRSIPAPRPALLVSLARSGQSPESCAAVEHFLRYEPQVRHLIVTCNSEGRLAVEFAGDPRVTVIALDDLTNDRSLAMTSSFTNMVLAGRMAGMIDRPAEYVTLIDRLAAVAEGILRDSAGAIADFVGTGFRKALYLGSGSAFAAAREGALKLLEMTAGRVTAMPESFLGVRHGPMSWVDAETLVVALLSSDPVVRAYELDLLEELDRKQIGARRVIIGDTVPESLRRDNALTIDCTGLAAAGDDNAPVIYVLGAQLLALFRCLQEGLKPDAPSESGIITRVVGSFRIHRQPA
jgi:tagatose-6-phosphate ketose/aldose isomerase